MKKTTLIVLLMTMSLTTNIAFAQAKKPVKKTSTTATAKPAVETGPTKEETIAWIKEKLVKYLKFKSDNATIANKEDRIQLNECEFTMTYINENDKYTKIIMPTGDFKLGDDSNDRILTKNQTFSIYVIHWGNFSGDPRYVATYFVEHVRLSPGEEDLYKKLQKAFDHLATFCPKKKELF
jgi:hypothetical protein